MSAELAADIKVFNKVGGNVINGDGLNINLFYDVADIVSIKNTVPVILDTTGVVDIFGDGFGVALWQFNDNTDEASGNYQPTKTTTVTYTDGPVYRAVSLNGMNDNIEGPAVLTGTSASYSISVWCKFNNFDDQSSIYNTFYNDGIGGVDYKGHILRVNTLGQVQMVNMYGGLFGVNDYILSSSLLTNTWYHIVATWSTGVAKIYINGNLDITGGAGMKDVVNQPGKDYIIGNLESPEGTKSGFYDGDIDQMRFFTSEIDQSQVTTLFEEGTIWVQN